MFRASASFTLPLLLLLAACNSQPNQPPPDPSQPTTIDSFGATPNPSPINVGVSFSWSVTGSNLTCTLDAEGDGTVDYTVQDCTSQSRVVHNYGNQGAFTARLAVSGADGQSRSQITPVTVGAANIPPTIPTLQPQLVTSGDPLEVTFVWNVDDRNSDITHCQFDADSDGKLEYDNLCSGLPTTSTVKPSATVKHSVRHRYPKQGNYSATLKASDPYSSTTSSVKVRVPLNSPPVINTLSATNGPNFTSSLALRVSDPDNDTLSCKLTIQTIGTFNYPNCKTLTRNLSFGSGGSYKVTLEVSDGLQTTSKSLMITFDGPKPPPPMPGVCVESAPTGLIEDGFPLYGPFEAAYWVAFSPDGYHFATGDAHGFIQLWRFDKQGKVFFLANLVDPNLSGSDLGRAHEEDYIKDLVFSPDGRTLASVGWDDYVKLWDVPTTSHLATLDHPNLPATLTTDGEAVAFSPDGKVLAVGDEAGLLSLYDVSDPENPDWLSDAIDPDDGTDAGGWVDDLKFTPDGKTLISGHNVDRQVRLWNVSNPASPARLAKVADRNYPNLGFPEDVYDMAISPDGKYLAIGGNAAGIISVVNITNPASPTDAAQPVLPNGAYINTLAYSPDGKILAMGNGSGEIYLFDASSPLTDSSTPVGSILNPNAMDGNVEALAFSPDGKYLVATGNAADIVMWNLSNPASPAEHFREIPEAHEVYKVAFLDDSWLVQANSDDAELLFINRAPGQFGRAATPLAYDTNSGNNFEALVAGSGIVAGGYTDYTNYPNTEGYVELWDASDPTSATHSGTFKTGLSSVDALALFPDGKTLAVGGEATSTANLELWNIGVTPPVKLSSISGYSGKVVSIAISPDGNTMVTGDEGPFINLVNVSNPASTSNIDFLLAGGSVTSVDLTYPGSSKYLVASSDDGEVKLFDIGSLNGSSLNSPSTVETGADSTVIAAFTRDGSSVVTTDQATAEIRVRKLTNLGSVDTYPTSAAEFTQLVFSPNGHVLATPSSLSNNYQTRLWYWNYAIICPAW